MMDSTKTLKEQFRRLADWHKKLQVESAESGEGMLGHLLDEGWVAEADEFFSGVWHGEELNECNWSN